MGKGVEISAIVLLCIATGLNIVVLAIPEWLYMNGLLKLGIFQMCIQGKCVYYLEVESKMSSAQSYRHGSTLDLMGGAAVLATLCTIIAVVMTSLFVATRSKRKASYMSAALGLSITAGVLNLIGASIWLYVFLPISFASTLGPAFYLNLVTPVLSFIHAGLCPMIKRRGMQEVNPSLFPQPLTNDANVMVGMPDNQMAQVYPDVHLAQHGYGGAPAEPPAYPHVIYGKQ